MDVIWFKVWYDLWHHKGRSLLVISSISAGVFAIGALFGLVDQLLSGMDRAHQAVNPSHINIILRDYIDEAVVAELRRLPGVAEIDPINQISVRYKLNPDDSWKLGTLNERPDYTSQAFDVVSLSEGAWPADGQLAIERLSGQYFGVSIGEEVIFQNNGAEVRLEVGGKIRHPFVQPPQFGGQANFFSDAAGLAEFGIAEGYFGQLLVQVEEPYSREKAQDVAGEIRSQLSQKGLGVIVSLYQDPDKHWGRRFVEGVTLVLQIMAVVSLFLSVVLVLNTMTALITQQTDQIGILKAIGGTSGTIIKIFLVEVVVLGALALLIALPLGLAFAFFLSQNFLNLFNIDYTNFSISLRAVIWMAVAALLAPILAALWPVLKGAAISVREAIATYGLGADFGANRFDRAIERLGARYLSTVYAAALGNTFRRKGRLVFTLLVLTFAGVMFLVVMSLISSIRLTLDNETNRQGYDIRIGFTQNQPIPDALKLARSVQQTDQAEIWYSRNATILRAGERLQDSAGLGAQLIGIPAGTNMYTPLITEGRWLQPGETERVIVINQDTADKNNIQVGNLISLDLGELGADTWEVVGTYRTVYSSGFVVEPIYAPLEAVALSTGINDEGTQILVKGKAIQSLEAETDFANQLKTAFEESGFKLDFYTTSAKRDARSYADNQFNTVVNMLINLAILIATVGGIGLMGSLGIGVVERTREIGVMRAIGAQNREIGNLFIMEGVLHGLISFILSVPLAYFLAQPLARLLGQTMIQIDLDFAFNYAAVGIWFAAILLISIVFSLLPARNATRVSVRQSLNYA